MHFYDFLENVVKQNNSLLCIGLDPVIEKIPQSVKSHEFPFFEFNKQIIDATHDLVCAYKPNSAFYEALGHEGIFQLKQTCDYIKKKYPDVVLICDAKRGDIGKTNEKYAYYCFDFLSGDAATLQPYFGGEALEPFLRREDKGCMIMCKNSNSDSGEFQDLIVNEKPLYQIIAKHFITHWNNKKNIVLVVGATYPEQMQKLRNNFPNIVFLVPGIGSQGGSVQETVQAGQTSNGKGLIISASSSIIYSSGENNFAQVARQKAMSLQNEINLHRIKLLPNQN